VDACSSRRMCEHLEAGLEAVRRLGVLERRDQVGHGVVIDAAAAQRRGNRQADGPVGVADPGWLEEDGTVAGFDEVELAEALERLASNRWRLLGSISSSVHSRQALAPAPSFRA
jgi:hypothetical protein